MCAGADEIYIREWDLEVFDTESRDSWAIVLFMGISQPMIFYGKDRVTPADGGMHRSAAAARGPASGLKRGDG